MNDNEVDQLFYLTIKPFILDFQLINGFIKLFSLTDML